MALQPQGWSFAALPLASLSSIERIEVNATRARDSVAYYVLDVFLHRFNTRLPAHLIKLRDVTSTISSRSSSSLSSPSSPTPERVPSKPYFQVERRFSEFAQLRAQVYNAACLEPQFQCAYCYLAFIECVRVLQTDAAAVAGKDQLPTWRRYLQAQEDARAVPPRLCRHGAAPRDAEPQVGVAQSSAAPRRGFCVRTT